MSPQTPSSAENLRLILGLKLKKYRHEKGLSLKELSEKTGLSLSYISEIESGKKYPKPEKMITLAKALDISFDDLVSQKVDETLDPLAELMESDLVREFPFDLFGIAPRDILHLFSDEPKKAASFLHTFFEISRAYDMSVEHFLLAALRTYQKLHYNYFEEIEDQAADYRKKLGLKEREIPDMRLLQSLLEKNHGYNVDYEAIAREPELKSFRSIWIEGKEPRLCINPELLDSQKAFVLGRDLAYELFKLKQRAQTSSWMKVESFEQLLNNFRASYFAGALLLPRQALVKDLEAFISLPLFDNKRFLQLMDDYNATPEMFLYRLSQLLPGVFDLKDLFYLRFTYNKEHDEFALSKELNMTQMLVPYGIGLNEHYCRRWLPVKLLQQIIKNPGDRLCGIQRVRFVDEGTELVMISIARPLQLSPGKHSAMTIGFLLNEKARRLFGFLEDPDIPFSEVGETCERCQISNCEERVALPRILEQRQKLKRQEQALKDFLNSI